MIKAVAPILRDYLRAVRMRCSLDANRRSEGRTLAFDAGRRFISWLLIPLGSIAAGVIVLSALIPPYGVTSIALLAMGICSLWLAFPIPLKVRDTGKILIFRLGAVFFLTMTTAIMMGIPESKEERQRALAETYHGIDLTRPTFDLGRHCLSEEKKGNATFWQCLGIAATKAAAQSAN